MGLGKSLIAILFLILAASVRAGDWKPEDIHPKVFQMIQCWISDTEWPVVTEINLDAVRRNRNQFDYSAVKDEDGWITFRDGSEMLRFRISDSRGGEYSVRYQENGGGSLTTERVMRFTISSRKMEVDGLKREVSVLRVVSIASENKN